MYTGKQPWKDASQKWRKYEDKAVETVDKVNSKKGRRVIFYVVAGIAVAAILAALSLGFGGGS